MGEAWGGGKSIGQGWYRSYINVYGSSSTNTTYTYKVRCLGQLQNIDGWSASYMWRGDWKGSSYSWTKIRDGNMYCSWSSGYNNTNFDNTYTFTVNRTTSDWNAWHACSVQCSSNGESQTSSYVTIPKKPSYAVSYNGNSTYNSYTNSTVSNTPGGQTKWYGDNLTLSSTKPTKANTTANGYTVTYNYNYSGSTNTTDTPTDTYSYTFSKWNTSSDGKGTNYNAGATYSSNSAATLYAIWDRSVSRGSVELPTPSRAGFTFLGWSTNSTATTGTYNGGDSYTPTAVTTLYAIWRANLGEGYILKATSSSATWADLIATQTEMTSTLYKAGGEYSGWSVDSSGYVVCFGFRIKLNGSTLVKGTDKPIRGAKYYYYIS